MVICASCGEKLWASARLPSGREAWLPATPEVPFYDPTCHLCPFCEQEYILDINAHREVLLVRDERDGHLRTQERVQAA